MLISERIQKVREVISCVDSLTQNESIDFDMLTKLLTQLKTHFDAIFPHIYDITQKQQLNAIVVHLERYTRIMDKNCAAPIILDEVERWFKELNKDNENIWFKELELELNTLLSLLEQNKDLITKNVEDLTAPVKNEFLRLNTLFESRDAHCGFNDSPSSELGHQGGLSDALLSHLSLKLSSRNTGCKKSSVSDSLPGLHQGKMLSNNAITSEKGGHYPSVDVTSSNDSSAENGSVLEKKTQDYESEVSLKFQEGGANIKPLIPLDLELTSGSEIEDGSSLTSTKNDDDSGSDQETFVVPEFSNHGFHGSEFDEEISIGPGFSSDSYHGSEFDEEIPIRTKTLSPQQPILDDIGRTKVSDNKKSRRPSLVISPIEFEDPKSDSEESSFKKRRKLSFRTWRKNLFGLGRHPEGSNSKVRRSLRLYPGNLTNRQTKEGDEVSRVKKSSLHNIVNTKAGKDSLIPTDIIDARLNNSSSSDDNKKKPKERLRRNSNTIRRSSSKKVVYPEGDSGSLIPTGIVDVGLKNASSSDEYDKEPRPRRNSKQLRVLDFFTGRNGRRGHAVKHTGHGFKETDNKFKKVRKKRGGSVDPIFTRVSLNKTNTWSDLYPQQTYWKPTFAIKSRPPKEKSVALQCHELVKVNDSWETPADLEYDGLEIWLHDSNYENHDNSEFKQLAHLGGVAKFTIENAHTLDFFILNLKELLCHPACLLKPAVKSKIIVELNRVHQVLESGLSKRCVLDLKEVYSVFDQNVFEIDGRGTKYTTIQLMYHMKCANSSSTLSPISSRVIESGSSGRYKKLEDMLEQDNKQDQLNAVCRLVNTLRERDKLSKNQILTIAFYIEELIVRIAETPTLFAFKAACLRYSYVADKVCSQRSSARISADVWGIRAFAKKIGRLDNFECQSRLKLQITSMQDRLKPKNAMISDLSDRSLVDRRKEMVNAGSQVLSYKNF
jgi:hypothetical protein